MLVHFVGGVHGAGKSTLCVRLQAVLGCDYAKASDLLRFESIPGEATGKKLSKT